MYKCLLEYLYLNPNTGKYTLLSGVPFPQNMPYIRTVKSTSSIQFSGLEGLLYIPETVAKLAFVPHSPQQFCNDEQHNTEVLLR